MLGAIDAIKLSGIGGAEASDYGEDRHSKGYYVCCVLAQTEREVKTDSQYQNYLWTLEQR